MSGDSSLPERLRQLLSDPESLPRPTVPPELSYGRHRGPANLGSRIAAVVIALYQDANGEWTIPLTRRPSSLQHHGGQICLPGGQVEPDENILQAALREFEEELGVRPEVTCRCGELSTQYVYASDNLVHPLVVLIQPPSQPWKPDPLEVEEVIPLHLSVLLNESSRTKLVKQRSVRMAGQEVGKLSFRAPAIEHDEHVIWGATALILDQLARILQRK
jgi:8-oxo-dGTP pyrophosphatase MutT (NUDIX family)